MTLRIPRKTAPRARRRLSPWLRLTLATLCVAWLCTAAPARAQEVAVEDMPIVESVDVQGSQFLQKETLLFYVSTKAGERLDERRLKDDFRRLWDTGFLDDMRLDVLDGAQGKTIVFTVKERKRIQIVDYRGSKALTTSNIEDSGWRLRQSLRQQFLRALEFELKRTRSKALRFRRLFIVAANFRAKFHRSDTSMEILYGRGGRKLKLIADIRMSIG